MSDMKEKQGIEVQGKHEKRPFNAPKLTFIVPKLTKQGDSTKITSGQFGTFLSNP